MNSNVSIAPQGEPLHALSQPDERGSGFTTVHRTRLQEVGETLQQVLVLVDPEVTFGSNLDGLQPVAQLSHEVSLSRSRPVMPQSGQREGRTVLGMYDDRDVATYVERLGSGDPGMRALAADESTDGVSDWGRHSYTDAQAQLMTTALVDALLVESDDVAREAILNALATLAEWDLTPRTEVLRVLAAPRPDAGSATEHWDALEAWTNR